MNRLKKIKQMLKSRINKPRLKVLDLQTNKYLRDPEQDNDIADFLDLEMLINFLQYDYIKSENYGVSENGTIKCFLSQKEFKIIVSNGKR